MRDYFFYLTLAYGGFAFGFMLLVLELRLHRRKTLAKVLRLRKLLDN